jgi:hypothetical protein
MLSVPLLKNWIAWFMGTGSIILVGLDPFVGSGPSFRLSSRLIRHLHYLNIFSLAHINHTSSLNSSRSHDWLTHSDLGLEGDLASEWDSYISMLICNSVSISNEANTISWTCNKALGAFIVKFSYEALVGEHVKEEPELWFNAI